MSVNLKPIQLRPGMIIVEGKTKMPVREIDMDGCDRTHVHVNNSMCYHRNALVSVQE